MDWPTDLVPYRWTFYLQNRTTVFRSPLTGTRQVLARQGARWIGSGAFRFGREKAQRFEALLAKMRGAQVTANVWDFAHPEPLGPALDVSSLGVTYLTTLGSPGGRTGFLSGSPTVRTGFAGGAAGYTVHGAHAAGDDTVVIRGFPQATTQLYAGDYVGIGGYLYMIEEDATADALNRATLQLNRELVADVASGSAVTITRPRTPMMLADDDQPARNVDVNRVYEYSVSLVEAFA